jgi:hypothetical protein
MEVCSYQLIDKMQRFLFIMNTELRKEFQLHWVTYLGLIKLAFEELVVKISSML